MSQGPTEHEPVSKEIEAEHDGAAKTMFASMTEIWVTPEIERRRQAGTWGEDDVVYRFQVQFLDEDEVVVRVNDEVKGVLTVKANGPVEKDQEVYMEDFSEISSYQLPDEYAHHPHVTAVFHHETWFMGYQLGHRDPSRHEVLAAGREFLAAAADDLQANRLRPFFDNANSAVELLAKAELLSCAPTIEIARESGSHRTLSQAYNVWVGHLENGDRRFSDALNRLAKLRRQGRYLTTELEADEGEANEILGVLQDMERHVSHLAEAPMHELPNGFSVLATRELKAGELLGAEAMTVFPGTLKTQRN
jgi:hypothetical protein